MRMWIEQKLWLIIWIISQTRFIVLARKAIKAQIMSTFIFLSAPRFSLKHSCILAEESFYGARLQSKLLHRDSAGIIIHRALFSCVGLRSKSLHHDSDLQIKAIKCLGHTWQIDHMHWIELGAEPRRLSRLRVIYLRADSTGATLQTSDHRNWLWVCCVCVRIYGIVWCCRAVFEQAVT